jgi:uncharacterized membrane protein
VSFAIFTSDGLYMLLRWLHYIFGVIWIGHLYYFNFTQGPFFAETDATTKSNAIQKLLPRALWWFRWGAMFTFLTGLGMLKMKAMQSGWEVFGTSWGINILVGSLFATMMFLNVWLIIWPNQKVVIANAEATAKGQAANPAAARAGAVALLGSRTNTMFSFPMLFFMGTASHLPIAVDEASNPWLLFGVLGALIAAFEINIFKGKLGPMTSVKGVIHCALALTVVVYALLEVLI